MGWRGIVAKKQPLPHGRGSDQEQLPVQPVDRPILCNPYEEPRDHWIYDKETGAASRAGTRRPASYWYKTERTGSAQLTLTGLAEEERDDLPLVSALGEYVRKCREAGYPSATNVTRDLLRHWARADRGRRLFFCQVEAVETIIYLQEIRFPGKVGIRGNPKLGKEDLNRMLAGQRPSFSKPDQDFFPRLIDPGQDATLAAHVLGSEQYAQYPSHAKAGLASDASAFFLVDQERPHNFCRPPRAPIPAQSGASSSPVLFRTAGADGILPER